VSDRITQPVNVHRADLFDKYARHLTVNEEIRAKCCGTCASRRRSHQYDRTKQEGVGLNDDAETPTVLLVPNCPW
jgi:hypothetical protein